jgi:dihydroorotate dehydrogenase electron transfer subunit
MPGMVAAVGEPWPGMQEVTLGIPGMGQAAAGQFVLAHLTRARDPVLPAALLVRSHNAATGLLHTLVPAHTWFGGVEDPWPGQSLQLAGPFGHPFSVDRRSRRALLLGSGVGIGALLFLAQRLVDDGQDVTFIGVGTAQDGVLPANMLPHAVEYIAVPAEPGQETGDSLVAAVDPLLTWADALFIALPIYFLTPLTRALRRRLLRLRKGYAQALVLSGWLPCGVGACDLCIVATREGYRRLCRGGLVFDLLSLA